mmetsp:Transcript_6407/g.8811  ORF Transcript_6407/g.8811 Transcript_6407/m.8811 type:complete len:383 (-) Transcript_6407:152-1300(-)|eukprot:CAMPEP_0184479860 /NCGR_PEP_ID=MMETSP0113_2-20130426/1416_1 /TAXON_ID=91329 /ORGANISM="Norrisiella sphaerica, Strain BC52" /LENGTH=382 /DNA_ID=CAMNT_0026858021 /DNA_START=151 /DNA_END=1299 /DNA_ORIENTATION=+
MNDDDETKLVGDNKSRHTVLVSPNPTVLVSPKPTDYRAIYVKYIYIPYVSRINCAENLFELRVDVDLYWKASERDIKLWDDLKAKNEESNYVPLSYVPNVILQNASEKEITTVTQKTGGQYYIDRDVVIEGESDFNFVRLQIVGTFLQEFVLDRFPFDVQVLRLPIGVSFTTYENTRFKPFKAKDHKVAWVLQEFSALNDWQVLKVTCEMGHDGSTPAYPFIVTDVVVRRLPWSTLWKYFVPVSLLLLSSLAGYSVSSIGDRLAYLITLFLSYVGIQYSIDDRNAVTPRPTFTDYFIVSAIVLTTFMIFQAALSKQDEDGNLEDFIWLYVFSTLVAFLHVMFIIWGIALYVQDEPDNKTRRERYPDVYKSVSGDGVEKKKIL